MYNIDNEKFGAFIATLRKEKGYTQKQLAERLLLSDKAISKYERGLCFPDISLLEPMAQLLDVSIAELLHGEKQEASQVYTDDIVNETLNEAANEQRKKKTKSIVIFFIAFLLMAIELLYILSVNITFQQLQDDHFFSILFISFLCGAYFFLIVKDRLPIYYDENKIHFVSNGVFRINIPGVHFNNSNWPYIIQLFRFWAFLFMAGYPLGYFLSTDASILQLWQSYETVFLLVLFLLLFIPIYVIAKRYE